MNADRYDTTANPEAQFEPGSNALVLKNKLGIQHVDAMDDVELDLLVQLYDWIPDWVEADQQLTSTDIREWHHRWLGNLFSWSGQYRSVNMGKGEFQFAAATQIDRLMSVLDRDFLSRYTPCLDMSFEQLVEAIAKVHIELILIHPFREGNGRISRVLANVMAMQAGKPELDFSSWDERKNDYFSAIQSGLDDYQPMMSLVRQALQDAVKNEDG